jgi:thiamine biosynthesis lipoprotein
MPLIHTFETMGTVVNVRVDDQLDSAVSGAAFDAVERVFTELNERFSLYREDSEISQIARGELRLAESSEQMREAYAEAISWREKTGGAFSPDRPDGVLDLSGTIKAVAIQQAADALREVGATNFSVNAGGDILVSGHDDLSQSSGLDEDTWSTGIVHPRDRTQLLTAVRLTATLPAMATSGSAERGEHIWLKPGTDQTFQQVSVLAPDILMADVLATAIVAGGHAQMAHAVQNFPVAVFAIDHHGEFFANALFEFALAD